MGVYTLIHVRLDQSEPRCPTTQCFPPRVLHLLPSRGAALQSTSASEPQPAIRAILLHGDGGAKLLHGGDDLLGLVLGHVLLHQLRRALDELLAVHQAQTQQVLDLLDDLGLGTGLEGLELDVEDALLGGRRCGLLSLLDSGGSCCRGGGEATNGEIGDVELGLRLDMVSIQPMILSPP